MKLLILSDLHLEFAPFDTAPDVEVDVVILAGDIWRPGHRVPLWVDRLGAFHGKEVIFVAGNHEYYRTWFEQERIKILAEAVACEVHFLDPGQVVLGGVRFLGTTLWTDFALRVRTPGRPDQTIRLVADVERAMAAADRSLNDFRYIRSGEGIFTPAQALVQHWREREYLLNALRQPFNGPTVVVTHHAPHRGSLAPRFEEDWLSPCFVSELPQDFFEVPKLWIHGHTHTSCDYQVGDCRVLSNPRGYPLAGGGFENPFFDERLVVAV